MKSERIAIICLTAGLITVGATTYTKKEIKQVEVVQEYQDNNLELERSIKEEISKVGRIEVLQMQVGKRATIDNKSKLDMFKKELTIDFKVNVHFYLNITDTVSITGNTITVYTKEPDIESSINYDLTTFKQENGVFAYGDLKLTPGYNQEIENTVCNKVNEEAKEENEEARCNAEKILEDLLVKSNNRMNVKIVYVR